MKEEIYETLFRAKSPEPILHPECPDGYVFHTNTSTESFDDWHAQYGKDFQKEDFIFSEKAYDIYGRKLNGPSLAIFRKESAVLTTKN